MVQYPNSIPIAIGECVTALNTAILADLQAYSSTIETVQYMYGNWKEIIKTMSEYTQDPTLRTKKFPVVLLIEDTPIDQRNTDFFGTANMNIIIANATDPKYSSSEREPLFANILRPIHNELCKQLFKHGLFTFKSQRDVRATQYVERKFWGRDDNSANALGDYIDAIELIGLNAGINWKWCEQTINENL